MYINNYDTQCLQQGAANFYIDSYYCGLLARRQWPFEQEHTEKQLFIVFDLELHLSTTFYADSSLLSRVYTQVLTEHLLCLVLYCLPSITLWSIFKNGVIWDLCLLFPEDNSCSPLSFTDVCLHARSTFCLTASGLKWVVDRVYKHTAQISST